MKKTLIFTLTIIILFSINGSVWAEVARIKEVVIQPQVNAIQLSSFQGSIKWIPITSEEKARIVVEIIASGVSQIGVRNALLQVRIVENIQSTSILLEARRPILPAGVDYVAVNYLVYAQPGQFRQFKAQTALKPIEIISNFNAELTLLNHNAPIILHAGQGLVNLETSNAHIDLGELALTLSSQILTSNGSIVGLVSLPAQGSFFFQTTNAPINLKLPSNTLGNFNLSTSLGVIDFQLGDDLINGIASATITRSMEPIVNVSTTNSTITISAIN